MRGLKEKPRSAGFIVVSKWESSWRVLGLRVWGKFDIPKGHVEAGESDLEAAIRECQEEAGIEIQPPPSDVNMKWGTIRHISERKYKDVIVYLAITEDEPVIRPNPETNRYEHECYNWLTWDQMRRCCYPYLIDVVNWAQQIIEGRK